MSAKDFDLNVVKNEEDGPTGGDEPAPAFLSIATSFWLSMATDVISAISTASSGTTSGNYTENKCYY